MNITFFHELDTGFMAATLKPAFEELGHKCTIMQGWQTNLESNTLRVDYLLKDMDSRDIPTLTEEYKETDLFILRAGDALLQDAGILSYITKHNSIYRLHGHDITFLGRPYRLRAWRVNWHNNEPQVVTYPDHTFLEHFKTPPIYIERPIDLTIIPRSRKHKEVFALSTPTNMEKKGANALAETWKTKDIPLKILSAFERDKALALKAQCTYFIDNVSNTYHGGPYGMNSVEAWLLQKPVFSRYSCVSSAICPELPKLINHVTINNVQDTIENFEIDRKQLSYAKNYALRVHDPLVIAQQYIDLARYLKETEQ
jgi:hypothetical protein